jgi:diacylglycerol kinase family enzyme
MPKPVPREAVLIVNTRSRSGQKLLAEAAAKLEAAGIHLIAKHSIRKPGADLIPTMKAAVRDGAPMVIVGGGDGSLSCTIDEVVGRDCVFALLPLGTANSFARTLGIPLDLDGRSTPSPRVSAAGSMPAQSTTISSSTARLWACRR